MATREWCAECGKPPMTPSDDAIVHQVHTDIDQHEVVTLQPEILLQQAEPVSEDSSTDGVLKDLSACVDSLSHLLYWTLPKHESSHNQASESTREQTLQNLIPQMQQKLPELSAAAKAAGASDVQAAVAGQVALEVSTTAMAMGAMPTPSALHAAISVASEACGTSATAAGAIATATAEANQDQLNSVYLSQPEGITQDISAVRPSYEQMLLRICLKYRPMDQCEPVSKAAASTMEKVVVDAAKKGTKATSDKIQAAVQNTTLSAGVGDEVASAGAASAVEFSDLATSLNEVQEAPEDEGAAPGPPLATCATQIPSHEALQVQTPMPHLECTPLNCLAITSKRRQERRCRP